MVNLRYIVPVLAAVLANPASAHITDDDYDRFENAVQCAGLWLGQFAAQAAAPRDMREMLDQMSYEMGMTYRDVALDAQPEKTDEVDYLIGVWSVYFTRLTRDSSGQFPPVTSGGVAQWADEQFLRHERFCQGFGLSLGEEWGFH